jgi:hypothetical protein
MGPVAVAIALGYGVAALGLLGRRRLREPWLLAAGAAGALAFQVALLLTSPIQLLFASLFGWDMDAYSTSLGIGLAGIAITASVNEVFKLAAALLLWSLSERRGGVLAFGAASGAGFGIVGAYQVILLALATRALPISSPAGFAASLVQQFAFVATSAATGAVAAHGMARRRLGTYLAAAILCESAFSALGLLVGLRVYTSLLWAVLSLGVALLLLASAFVLSLRPAPAADSAAP